MSTPLAKKITRQRSFGQRLHVTNKNPATIKVTRELSRELLTVAKGGPRGKLAVCAGLALLGWTAAGHTASSKLSAGRAGAFVPPGGTALRSYASMPTRAVVEASPALTASFKIRRQKSLSGKDAASRIKVTGQ